MAGKVIFHLPEGYLNRYRNAKHLALYPQVEDALLRRGGQVEIASRLAKLRPGESRKDDAAGQGRGIHGVTWGKMRVASWCHGRPGPAVTACIRPG